ncbi:MAG: Inner membrane protein YhaI [Chlamydiae bacterium]|nr:Inner membrane protein YhaI [Chlamydiota bacterium]
MQKSAFQLFFECYTKKHFVFDGRATRKEAWSFLLLSWWSTFFIIDIYSRWFSFNMIITKNYPPNQSLMETLSITTFVVFFLVSFLPGIAVTIRRFHDLNMGGGWWFGLFVPFLGLILSILLSFKKGTEGANKYGEPIPSYPRKQGSFKLFMECMTKKYFDFRGKAGRQELLFFFLYYFIGSILFSLIHIFLNIGLNLYKIDIFSHSYIIFSNILSFFSHIFLIPALALFTRRLHGANRSRWWLLMLIGVSFFTFYFLSHYASIPLFPFLFVSSGTAQFFLFLLGTITLSFFKEGKETIALT